MNQIAKYDFTLPKNETYPDHLTVIRTVCTPWCKQWCFQLERGDTGYEHWQGRVSLIKKRRIKELLGRWCVGGHISPTCSDSPDNLYVTKQDTRLSGPWSDLDWGDGPVLTRQLTYFMDQPLRCWQEEVIEMVKQPDDRSIKLIIDKIGNTGKSILCEYLEYQQLAYEIPPMREMGDIMQCVMSVKAQKAYVVDMPRALKKDKLASFYSGLEALKNGVAYDGRYQFKKKRFDRPQIIVFTNTEPDLSLLSIDRWEIWDMYSETTMYQREDPGRSPW